MVFLFNVARHLANNVLADCVPQGFKLRTHPTAECRFFICYFAKHSTEFNFKSFSRRPCHVLLSQRFPAGNSSRELFEPFDVLEPIIKFNFFIKILPLQCILKLVVKILESSNMYPFKPRKP